MATFQREEGDGSCRLVVRDSGRPQEPPNIARAEGNEAPPVQTGEISKQQCDAADSNATDDVPRCAGNGPQGQISTGRGSNARAACAATRASRHTRLSCDGGKSDRSANEMATRVLVTLNTRAQGHLLDVMFAHQRSMSMTNNSGKRVCIEHWSVRRRWRHSAGTM